jgi:hypothetical protein
MPDELLSDRVERLEQTVEGLQTLPAQVAVLGERVGSVETQIVQLRGEMRVEFSDVRTEMRTEFADVRSEMRTEFGAVRDEMRTEFAAVRSEMQTGFAAVRSEMQTESAAVRGDMDERFAGARDDMLIGLANVTNELRHEIRESAEEGQRRSRVLFEEVLGRIAALGENREGLPRRKPRAPRRKR